MPAGDDRRARRRQEGTDRVDRRLPGVQRVVGRSAPGRETPRDAGPRPAPLRKNCERLDRSGSAADDRPARPRLRTRYRIARRLRELLADDQNAAARHPDIAAHLAQCGPCSKDLHGLLNAIHADTGNRA